MQSLNNLLRNHPIYFFYPIHIWRFQIFNQTRKICTRSLSRIGGKNISNISFHCNIIIRRQLRHYSTALILCGSIFGNAGITFNYSRVTTFTARIQSNLTKVQPETKGALPAAIYHFRTSHTAQYLVLFLSPNFSDCQPFFQFDSQIQPIRKIRTFLGSFTKKISSVFSEIKRRFSLAFPADNSLLQQHSQSVSTGSFS